MRRVCLCGFLVLSGYAWAQSVSGEPASAPVWGFPTRLAGPLDATLPPYAIVWEVRVCPDDRGRVGIAWRRQLSSRSIEWDKNRNVWRVRGTTETLDPGPLPSNLPPVALDPNIPQLPVGLFGPGEYFGMAVVGADDKVITSSFLPDYGQKASVIDMPNPCSNLGFSNGRWYVTLADIPTEAGARSPVLVRFDSSGWQSPAVLLPTWGTAFLEGDRTDLFSVKLEYPPGMLPDFMGGRQRPDMIYTRIDQGVPGSRETLFKGTIDRGVIDKHFQVLRLGSGRYDLIFERSTIMTIKRYALDDLMHVPDLLSGRRGTPARFAQCERLHTLVVMPLSGNRLQAVWMEEIWPNKTDSKNQFSRLSEAHWTGASWSKPRVLAEQRSWVYESLAAAASPNSDTVVVLWKGERGRLTYAIGSPGGEWSAPATADLTVGVPNWVCAAGGGFLLVTRMDRNLYYCHFGPPSTAKH